MRLIALPRNMPTANDALIAERYRIENQLGKGGMGEVWSAVDLLSKKKLAIKRLALSRLSSPDSGTRPTPTPTNLAETIGTSPREERTSPATLDPAVNDATVNDAAPNDATLTLESGTPTPAAAKTDPAQLDSPRIALATPTPPTSNFSQTLRFALAQEFRVLASLRHPGIISVLDYGFDEQREPYVTMELLENPVDLFTATRDLPPVQQVSLLIKVLQALVYLHRREILHRDLKPHNVLVQHGNVKVLDFGLAINRSAAAAGLAGTVSYMAPEIFRGRSASVASDLYSFGVMAYQVLAGERPFRDSKNIQEILDRRTPTFEAIGALQQELPANTAVSLAAVLERLLALNPAERYDSAVAVIEDLSAAIGEPPPPETSAIRESFLQAAEFVGRDVEIKEFRKLLDGVVSGRGATVLIGGESGVGKSRLVEELRTEALVRGVLVARGQAVAEAALPYQEWRDPLRRLCLGSDVRDEDLPYLQVFVPDIGDLLERKVVPPQRPDPGTLQQNLLASVSALLKGQRRPVLLILEDLHWTSDDSMTLLRELHSLALDHPLLIVGTFRNDEKPEIPTFMPRAHYMKLSRLRDDAIAKLSKSILGSSGTRPSVIEYLKKQTEGNVFFLVEVVRSLAESAGGLDLIASNNIPESLTTHGISQIVRRRLNRLPAQWWPAMEMAAVAGRQFDLDILESALPGTDIAEWLHVGAECAVLDLDEGRWRFAHDKLRETILASLNQEKSSGQHEKVALAIEHVYPEAKRPSARLAYHWAHAGNRENEQHYSALAGSEMLQGAAYAGAIEYLERAVELLPVISQQNSQQELGLQLDLGTAYLITKGHASAEMKRAFDRAGELCVALGDPTQLFRVVFGQSTFYLFRGELDACRELAERCLNLAAQSKNPEMLLEAHFALGNALYWQGEFAPAVEQMGQVVTQFQPYQHEVHTSNFGHNPRITCLTYGSWGTWALGYPDQALALAKESLALAEQFNHGFSRAIGVQTLAFLHQQRRDVMETKGFAEVLIEQCAAYPTYWIAGRFLLGWALARAGSVEQGLGIIREAWKQWTQMGAGLAHPFYTTFLLEVALQAGDDVGDRHETISLATAALEKGRGRGERSHEAELCRLRGELILKSTGDLPRAAADFREAVQVARRQQARSYELRALNSLYRETRDSEARSQLASAYAWFSQGFETEDLRTAKQLLEAR